MKKKTICYALAQARPARFAGPVLYVRQLSIGEHLVVSARRLATVFIGR